MFLQSQSFSSKVLNYYEWKNSNFAIVLVDTVSQLMSPWIHVIIMNSNTMHQKGCTTVVLLLQRTHSLNVNMRKHQTRWNCGTVYKIRTCHIPGLEQVQVRSQELYSPLPCERMRSKYLGHHSLLSRHISLRKDRKEQLEVETGSPTWYASYGMPASHVVA